LKINYNIQIDTSVVIL